MNIKEAIEAMHSHPRLEAVKKIGEDHVIIDREIFEFLKCWKPEYEQKRFIK